MTEISAGIVTKGVKVSPLETAKALARPETGFVTQLEWRPCIDPLNPADLVFSSKDKRMSTRHCEELTILCDIENSHRLKSPQIRSDRRCAKVNSTNLC